MRAPLALTPRTLGIAAAVLLVVVGVAYVVGKGRLVSPKGPALRTDAVSENVWTVQVIAWDGIGATQDERARIVMEFIRNDEQLGRLGCEPSAVQVRGAEQTRVYLGRASQKDDPALLDVLQKVQKYVATKGREKDTPFKTARIREWSDTTKS